MGFLKMKILKALKDIFAYFAFLLVIFYGFFFVKDLSKEKFQSEVYDYVLTNKFLSNKTVGFVQENDNDSIALLRRYDRFYSPYYNCEVMLNNHKYNTLYGDDALIKEFIIAHELGHCELYDFMNNEFIHSKLKDKNDELINSMLSFLGRNKKTTLSIHFEENLADYYATFVLLRKHNYSQKVYDMIENFSQKRVNKVNAIKDKFKGKVVLDFWTHDIGHNVLDLLKEIKENELYYKELNFDDFKLIAFNLALYNTLLKITEDKDVIQSIIVELIYYREINEKDDDFLYKIYGNTELIREYISEQYSKKEKSVMSSEKVYIGDL